MQIEVFGKPNCPYCDKAKMLLEMEDYEYVYYDISAPENKKWLEMIQDAGLRSVPQIFIDDEHIGGYDDLSKWVVDNY